MWDDILVGLNRYESAVLTAFDSTGFPFSVRCKPVADERSHRLSVEFPQEADLQQGRAGLLMHSHNEELWDMVQFFLRGELIYEAGSWYFIPNKCQGKPRPDGVLDVIKGIRSMRRTADRYLKHRGLGRPTVPWDDIQRLHQQADALRKASKSGS